jgi:hypothetical protein
MTLSLRAGIDWNLEAQADDLLLAHRATCTTAGEKTEILTETQLELRANREVYTSLGVADSQLFSGLYRRAFNPEMGQRPSRHRRTDD